MAKFIAAIALCSMASSGNSRQDVAVQAIKMKSKDHTLISLGDDDDDLNVDPNMATEVN